MNITKFTRKIASVLAFILLVGTMQVVSVPVAAAEADVTLALTTEAGLVAPGAEFDVYLELTETRTEGIAAIQTFISFDERLELVEAVVADEADTAADGFGGFRESITSPEGAPETRLLLEAFMGDDPSDLVPENTSFTGQLFRLTFRATANAADGSADIELGTKTRIAYITETANVYSVHAASRNLEDVTVEIGEETEPTPTPTPVVTPFVTPTPTPTPAATPTPPANPIDIIVGTVDAVSGATAAVPVDIRSNPGIVEMRFDLVLSAGLTLQLPISSEEDVDDRFSLTAPSPQGDGRWRFSFDTAGMEAVSGDILPLINLHLSVAESASGLLGVSLENVYAVEEEDAEELNPVVVNGGVNVVAPPQFERGDLSGDGRINANDTLRLRRHLARWPNITMHGSADFNNDGRITTADTLLLRRFLAGWGWPNTPALEALTVFAVQPFATAPTIAMATNVEAFPRETVDVPITIADNPGIFGMTLSVEFDDELFTLTGATNGGVWPGAGVMMPNWAEHVASPAWFDFNNMTNVVGDGTLVTLHFEVAANAEAGVHDIILSLDHNEINYLDEFGALQLFTDVFPTNGSINVGDGAGRPTPTPITTPTPLPPLTGPMVLAVSPQEIPAEVGESVEVPITVANNPGFTVLTFEVHFDGGIELFDENLENFDYEVNEEIVEDADVTPLRGGALVNLMFVNSERVEEETVLITLTPVVAADAYETILVTLEGYAAEDGNGEELEIDATGGVINVTGGQPRPTPVVTPTPTPTGEAPPIPTPTPTGEAPPTPTPIVTPTPEPTPTPTPQPIIPGDVNNSGYVDQADVVVLRSYLVGRPVQINTTNADIDGEQGIDIRDLTMLRLYLAGRLDLTPPTAE